MFLVFTLRAFLYKPFVIQVRSMRKMQEFAPEIAEAPGKKYGNDKQKLAAEMQKLQKRARRQPARRLPAGAGAGAGVHRPVPRAAVVQPVLVNGAPRTENYFFDQAGVESFNAASLFGAKLGAWVTHGLARRSRPLGTSMANMIIVMIPLMIAAGVFTHITARHSVARQIARPGRTTRRPRS